MSVTTIIDGAREALVTAINAKVPRPTLKELSLGAGKNHAYLHQYLRNNSPKELAEDVRLYLAKVLDIDHKYLLDKNKRDRLNTLAVRDHSPHNETIEGTKREETLPVQGKPSDVRDRIDLAEGQVGQTERPTFLVGINDAFAVYVSIESMVPRLKLGELVFVNPLRPPVVGDDVLIIFNDETATIKELVAKSTRTLTTLQHAPVKKVSYLIKEIRSVYLIEGTRRR